MTGDIIAVVLLLIMLLVAFLMINARWRAKKRKKAGIDDGGAPVCGGCPYANHCNRGSENIHACADKECADKEKRS